MAAADDDDVLAAPAPALVDALAYVDDELDAPGARDAVNALLLEEMRRFAPPADGYASRMPPASRVAAASLSPAVQVRAGGMGAWG